MRRKCQIFGVAAVRLTIPRTVLGPGNGGGRWRGICIGRARVYLADNSLAYDLRATLALFDDPHKLVPDRSAEIRVSANDLKIGVADARANDVYRSRLDPAWDRHLVER